MTIFKIIIVCIQSLVKEKLVNDSYDVYAAKLYWLCQLTHWCTIVNLSVNFDCLTYDVPKKYSSADLKQNLSLSTLTLIMIHCKHSSSIEGQ